MTVRLLALGDLHLGRRPRHLPEGLDEYELPAEQLTPAYAWRNAVEWAIANPVDAVLLAGDVVESENRYFEALGSLERGVRELARHGIPVIAVAGNHDFRVLDRLADGVEGFQLLGRDGTWEATTLEGRDGPLRIWGWSFPQRHYSLDPTTTFPGEPDTAPSIGLLHCHLDVADSDHAPTTRANLESLSPRAWLLGHIHKPDRLGGQRPVGYLGSVVGLDVSETGAHGPWLVEVDAHGGASAQQLPLAPLRWESLELDIGELESEDDLRHAVAGALRTTHDELQSRGELGHTRVVGVSVRLVGRSPLHRRLRRPLRELEAEDVIVVHDDTAYAVVQWVDDAAPRLDLDRIAAGSDPAALLARRLVTLRDPDSATRHDLITAARPQLEATAESGVWDALEPAALDDDAIADLLSRAGIRALEDLLAQVGSTVPVGSSLEQGDLF